MEFCFVEAKNQLLGYGVVMWENEKVDSLQGCGREVFFGEFVLHLIFLVFMLCLLVIDDADLSSFLFPLPAV